LVSNTKLEIQISRNPPEAFLLSLSIYETEEKEEQKIPSMMSLQRRA
jgi:hypothetical protein